MCAKFGLLLASLFGALALTPFSSNSDGDRSCVCNYDSTFDFFPVKVEADFSQHWSVEYKLSYKVIKNTLTGQTFYGYLCGTPPPQVIPSDGKLISLPLQRVGLTSSTFMPYLEFIGQRQNINYYGSSMDWVNLPCVKQLASDGTLLTASYREAAGATALTANLSAIFCDNDCDSLTTAFASEVDPPVLIGLSETKETTSLAVLEYVEFIALFFNRELVASRIVELASTRYECNKNEALDKAPVNVLWIADAWGKPGVFSMANCPNYYCELITDAGGVLLDHTVFNGSTVNSYGSYELTADNLLQYDLSTIDVLVYANDWETRNKTTWAPVEAAMGTVVSGSKVFDITKSNAWFERKAAQPDVLLLDMISALHPTLVPEHTRYFLREVNSETKGSSSLSTCADVKAPLTSGWVDLTCLQLQSSPTDIKIVIPPGAEQSTGALPTHNSMSWLSPTRSDASCATYEKGQPNHVACFGDDDASLNCPIACNLCSEIDGQLLNTMVPALDSAASCKYDCLATPRLALALLVGVFLA